MLIKPISRLNLKYLIWKSSFSRRYSSKRCVFASQLFNPNQEISYKDLSESISISHKLLTSNGCIDSSIPTGTILLPLLVRSLDKLINIIDDEMQGINANKVMMPSMAPISLFKQSDRWKDYQNDVYVVDDETLLSPTHEEMVTKMVSRRSNQRYPLLLYQITTKFRKEKRPRSGLLRSREFLMKDLYSFDAGYESAVDTYQKVCSAYERIFKRINLDVIKVSASTGDMGGVYSHEYQLLSDAGQDDVMMCTNCGHYFNQELLSKGAEVEENNLPLEQHGEEVSSGVARGEEQTTISESQSKEVNHNKIPLKCLNCSSQGVDVIESVKGIEVGHTFLLGTRYSEPFNAHFNVTTSTTNKNNLPSSSSLEAAEEEKEDDDDGKKSKKKKIENKKELLTMGSYGLGVTRLLAASIEVLSSPPPKEEPLKIAEKKKANVSNVPRDAETTTQTMMMMKWPLTIVPFQVVIILPKAGSKEEKMIGSGFGIKFATDIIQVSRTMSTGTISGSLDVFDCNSINVIDVLVDDRINKSIGKRCKDYVSIGIPYIIILGKTMIEESIPKFELLCNYNQGEKRLILTHQEILHFFRLKSLKKN